MRWKIAHSDTPMPAGFMGNGLISSDERFFVGARFVRSGGSHLNWGVLDLRTHAFVDNFRYRRDAQKYVEMGGLGA